MLQNNSAHILKWKPMWCKMLATVTNLWTQGTHLASFTTHNDSKLKTLVANAVPTCKSKFRVHSMLKVPNKHNGWRQSQGKRNLMQRREKSWPWKKRSRPMRKRSSNERRKRSDQRGRGEGQHGRGEGPGGRARQPRTIITDEMRATAQRHDAAQWLWCVCGVNNVNKKTSHPVHVFKITVVCNRFCFCIELCYSSVRTCRIFYRFILLIWNSQI